MRKPYIIPLTLICILFAFMLPSSLGKTHEVGAHPVHITQIKPISAPPHVKLATMTAVDVAPVVEAVSAPHGEWMNAAGIPKEQQGAAEILIGRESGWNPTAVNSIGACSLVQSLPCSKIGDDWRNPVTALIWGNQYVISRYTTWQVALNHSLQYNWY